VWPSERTARSQGRRRRCQPGAAGSYESRRRNLSGLSDKTLPPPKHAHVSGQLQEGLEPFETRFRIEFPTSPTDGHGSRPANGFPPTSPGPAIRAGSRRSRSWTPACSTSRPSRTTSRCRPRGQARLPHQRIPRRLHRGRKRRRRPLRARRRRVRSHDRPAEILRHVPLRTAPLRDDVRLGNQPCPRQAVRPHGRLRERLAGSGQGRLLHDPDRGVDGHHPPRTRVRPRRRPGTEGHSHQRPHHRRGEPGRQGNGCGPGRRAAGGQMLLAAHTGVDNSS